MLYTRELVLAARRWITPFREVFPNVAAPRVGSWLEHRPTGRRFHRVSEVYVFTIHNGQIADGWGLEDTYRRLKQLRIG